MNDSPQHIPSIFEYDIFDADFVVCDVETTGLSAERHRLTEIALVKISEGKIVDRFQTLCNPQQFIPREITEFTGITNEMVYHAPKIHEEMPEVKKFIGESIFVAHNVSFDRKFVDASLRRAGMEALQIPNLCTCRLTRRIYPKLKSKGLGSISSHLGIRIARRHRALGDADATALLLLHFIELLSEEFDITAVGELLSFQNKPVFRVVAPPKNVLHLKEAIAKLPHEPGVYLFYNKRGDVIYVGKAKNLRDRVGSYFYHNVGHTRKVTELVRNVQHLSFETTETELSALLTEMKYIKKHQPRFNTAMKRDRKFPFIRIDVADTFPTISWRYEIEEDGAEYFGPFSSRYAVESALDTINHLFLLRECGGTLRPTTRFSPCLYYDIKRCGAPCNETQSVGAYQKEVLRVKQFLSGKHEEMLAGLTASMEECSADMRFEDAADIRDRLHALRRVIRQQEVMIAPVQQQDFIIVTPARRTNVEAHFIRNGKLAERFFIDQENIPQEQLRAAIHSTYYTDQKELFESAVEDVHEMRVIAAWCLLHRNESRFLPVSPDATEQSMVAALKDAIAEYANVPAATPLPAKRAS